MKRIMYVIWKAAPTKLTVETNKLPEDTRGVPYQAQIKQFNREYTYGNPEKYSVDWFLIILWKVGIGDKKSPRAKMFPAIPAASLQIENVWDEPRETINGLTINNLQPPD